MPDYNSHETVLKLLSTDQEPEVDNRAKVREVTHFTEKEDGQWEPDVVSNMSGRPRYTFDKCNPVIDSIAGEIEQADFGIKVRPAGGESTKDLAKLYSGIIRNIQSMSDAVNTVFNPAARQMTTAGFDAWRVTQEWGDSDSFDQDLFIRKISNPADRVWFDSGAELQNMSDARHAFVLHAVVKDEYMERWPDGKCSSVGDARDETVYYYKPDFVIIGEILYKKETTKELVLMSNNAVYEDDEKFQSVVDDLLANGIKEVRRRKSKSHIVFSRKFDNDGWLENEVETVFDYIPVIPVYANFKVSENKVIYRGAINTMMDSQRVYNYAQSRAIEEGALSPRGKYWMTREQAKLDKATLDTMNTNANPVQTYTHVEGHPPPFWQGGAQINAGLQQTAADMSGNIIESSGVFAANQGNAPQQSGVAIELQQNKGDNSTIKYFKSQEIAITHTARIIVNAIPKAYDTKRIVRIIGEDGSSKEETINDEIYDQEQGKMVALNDIRKGKYDVTCDVGPAFKSRQQETARAFLDAATIDPSLLEFGKDIWLSNQTAPGFDAMAERARKKLLENGEIPDDQMTDEEKERAQALIEQAQAEQEAAANQEPSVMDQAIVEQTQANTADVVSRANERNTKAALSQEKQDFEELKYARELDLKERKMIIDMLNTQAQTLKTIKDSMGVDTIVGEGNVDTYAEQVDAVGDTQEMIPDED